MSNLTAPLQKGLHLLDLFLRLAVRDDRRTEADIQADVRQFILQAPFELDEGDVLIPTLESQLGDRRRIDVEVGATVIEVKKDLRRERVRLEAEEQLAGYVAHRIHQTDLRYVGVLTDGTDWYCYNLDGDILRLASHLTLTANSSDFERLVVWLEGVFATAHNIAPTAENIELRLGARSSAYALDRATLASIYERHKADPSVIMKRTLWARLLTSALGTQFEDSDKLFIEHTLLMNSAEVIAHAVLGLPLENIAPQAILSGTKFDESGIYGVVEPDFFDWIVEFDDGSAFVRTLSKRLARFNWAAVEQDVLKVLYESIIGADTRKQLGEYYTPDWLADVVVSETIDDPLGQRVLDAACGSGTFLFHAIRKYIAASEEAGHDIKATLDGVTAHVIGMDLHPVAVVLARVTYILAIGRNRLLNPERGTIHIPVYLGDSLQWQEQSVDLMSAGSLVIKADDDRELFSSELRFPDFLLSDASRFDQLVSELADKAANRIPNSQIPSLSSIFTRLGIQEAHRATIEGTFATMCRLHDEGRNHIWGYYVRNLARPLWLAREANRVDILIGNPPWLAYRHMTPQMQGTFRKMCEARHLWAGAKVATHQDLSALFTIRACELYLRRGGKFALVLPNAAIDREHYEGFRRGEYGDASGSLNLAFSPSWDIRRIRPHFFPRAACVVFGRRVEDGVAMPAAAEIWTGRLPRPNAHWDEIRALVTRTDGEVRRVGQITKSPYAATFAQGANILPRMAFIVERTETSTLGLPQGKIGIRSARTIQEKKPWKFIPSLDGVVESEFVRPYVTGDNIYPYRTGETYLTVLPCSQRDILTPDQIEMYPGLHSWWKAAEKIWNDNRSNESISLSQQIDWQSKLSRQLPIPPLRVVYNRSGMHVVAAKVENRRAVLSSGLYWHSANSPEEANFLCAILNSPVITELVRPFMTYGKDERDIAKHVWEVPIPTYDPSITTHSRLAELGRLAEATVSRFEINPVLHFAATRRHIREFLQPLPESREIDDIVFELIA